MLLLENVNHKPTATHSNSGVQLCSDGNGTKDSCFFLCTAIAAEIVPAHFCLGHFKQSFPQQESVVFRVFL